MNVRVLASQPEPGSENDQFHGGSDYCLIQDGNQGLGMLAKCQIISNRFVYFTEHAHFLFDNMETRL
jgi:hypothetical protein